MRLVIEGTYSEGNPDLPLLRFLNFVSYGETAKIGIEDPLIRSRTENLQVDFFAGGQWLKSNLWGFPNSLDHIYTLSGGGTYWLYDDEGMTSVSAHLTQGLGIFDATTRSSVLRSRYTGSGVFTALNVNGTRLQEFGYGFEGALSASGQLASRALLIPQECSYGGSVIGRGFDDSELVGDLCALGSGELRYNAGFASMLALQTVQFYGFADAGYVQSNGTLLPGELQSESAYSAGLGIRWRLNDNLSGWVEYAQPISRDIAMEGNRDGRVFVAITGGF